MGMVIGLLAIMHFVLYCLAGIWHLVKIQGFKNKMKYAPVTFFLSLLFGYYYLKLSFYAVREQSIYAFDMYFNILLSVPTTAIIAVAMIAFIVLRKEQRSIYHSLFPAILMTPFTALLWLLALDKELSASFNITYYY